jgi:hypothetical protein
MVDIHRRVFSDPGEPRTVVVIPSLSLPETELGKITGVLHYEERMLCMLMLLRLPRTKVVYVTSQPIHPAIIDYYLHLLPGVPSRHAERRLALLSCEDSTIRSLSAKVLERPRLLERIRSELVAPQNSHMTCFNTTAAEMSLAVRLGLPMYAADPALSHLGSKSGSREVFRSVGIPHPDGFEHLRDEDDVVAGLAALKRLHPDLDRAVVKLDEGFSGEGNALFDYGGVEAGGDLELQIRRRLPGSLACEAETESSESYLAKLAAMGGVVECFVESVTRSPSVQCRVTPSGTVELVSTHDQVLGGRSMQTYLGCSFPADPEYLPAIHGMGRRVAEVLARRGVIGRLGVDFVSVPTEHGWDHHAIEINLRKGGTTLPFLMLEFLTDGEYDPDDGVYRSRSGQPRYYVASDNVQSPAYRGLVADDLMDIAVCNGIHFDAANHRGVVFQLLGALSEFGKLGMVAIAESPDEARTLFNDTVALLDRETNGSAVWSGTVAP